MSWAAFGANALGTLVENLSNTYGTGDASRERQRKDAMHDYEHMERHGIQNRVAGAQAAGLHPLAALGFQAGPSPSIPVGSQVHPVQWDSTPKSDPNDPFRLAQIRLMNAQADEAESRARSSMRAIATQPGQPPVPRGLPTESENLVPGQRHTTLPGLKVVPNEIQASANGKTIGVHPGQTDINDPMLGRLTGMSEQMLKQTEDMELLRTAYFVAANKDRLLDFIVSKVKSLDARNRSDVEVRRELDSLARRHPPKGQPAKWPPRMHGGKVTERR